MILWWAVTRGTVAAPRGAIAGHRQVQCGNQKAAGDGSHRLSRLCRGPGWWCAARPPASPSGSPTAPAATDPRRASSKPSTRVTGRSTAARQPAPAPAAAARRRYPLTADHPAPHHAGGRGPGSPDQLALPRRLRRTGRSTAARQPAPAPAAAARRRYPLTADHPAPHHAGGRGPGSPPPPSPSRSAATTSPRPTGTSPPPAQTPRTPHHQRRSAPAPTTPPTPTGTPQHAPGAARTSGGAPAPAPAGTTTTDPTGLASDPTPGPAAGPTLDATIDAAPAGTLQMTTQQQTRKPHPKKEEAEQTGDNGHHRAHGSPTAATARGATTSRRRPEKNLDRPARQSRTERRRARTMRRRRPGGLFRAREITI